LDCLSNTVLIFHNWLQLPPVLISSFLLCLNCGNLRISTNLSHFPVWKNCSRMDPVIIHRIAFIMLKMCTIIDKFKYISSAVTYGRGWYPSANMSEYW
jgi:hypothetical protein